MRLTQSNSFSSWHQDTLSSSQWEQNSISDRGSGIRRVTVRQLLKATPIDDSSKRFQINGVVLNKIMLVANIRDECVISSGKSYDFDDGTGRIKGNAWKIISDFTFQPFAYARVVGELDQFNGFYSLKVSNIQPVYDAYEVYFHIMKAIQETLILEQGIPPAHGEETDHSTQNQDMDSLSQVFQHNMSISTATTKPTSRANKRRPRSKLERDLVSIVLVLTDDDDDAEGVFINDIVAELRASHSNVGPREISDAVEYLLKEEFITTSDDHHYQPGPRYRSKI